MRQFYIGNSKIHGKGIILGEDVKKGQMISRVKGPLKFLKVTNKKESLSHPNWIGVKKNVWIDPERPHKFLNHSCNPSAGVRGLTLFAVRDLKEGDEVTIDYSTIEGDDRWEMKCFCKEKNCRKTIKSIKYLTPSQFKAIPYIPAYFKKLYLNGHNGRKVYNKN